MSYSVEINFSNIDDDEYDNVLDEIEEICEKYGVVMKEGIGHED